MVVVRHCIWHGHEPWLHMGFATERWTVLFQTWFTELQSGATKPRRVEVLFCRSAVIVGTHRGARCLHAARDIGDITARFEVVESEHDGTGEQTIVVYFLR